MKINTLGPLLSCLFLIVALHSGLSQTVGGYGPVYTQEEVSSIYITINEDSLNQMIDNLENEHEYPADFTFVNSGINESISGVGIRLRGNTSLSAAKKSFRISFNTFDNIEWYGLEKMNLIAQANDPSLVRSKLCHDMYRFYDIHAARTSFVRLYINNEYRGLYLNVEHLDENYASRTFDEQGDGNLYKCTYPADLDFISNNPDDYKFANWGTRHYELQTNLRDDNYSDLAHFIDVLNNTPAADLACELPKVFDVESYLRSAAIDILLGSWDNYIFLKNNFYLYHHQLSDRFVYIPYDLDNTLGIDWIGEDWTQRNIYSWNMSGEERPLFTRLMANNAFKNRFTTYIQQFCNEYFTSENITTLAAQWQNMIATAVEEDSYYPLDFGYTYNDFLNAINDAWGQHVDFSIAEYVDARRSSALNQLAPYSPFYTRHHWTKNLNVVDSADDQIVLSTFITLGRENCDLLYSADNINWLSAGEALVDNGIDPDDAVDSIYTFSLANDGGGEKLYFETQINGNANECLQDFMWTSPSQDALYINEVMPSNSSVIADDNNEYDDWVEIWNGSNTSLNLGGKFLTDDIFNWNKYPLPAIDMPSSAHYLFWLDNDEEQGPMHGTFRLNASDTSLWLISLEEDRPRMVDEFYPITFGDNVSNSRYPDGSTTILAGFNASPGGTNIPLEVASLSTERFYSWPNPAKNDLYFSRSLELAELINMQGESVKTCTNCSGIDVSELASGIYFLRNGNNFYRIHVIH